MTLTSEYQYIGRSNAVQDQNSRYSYYLLLYAKTSGDTSTGRHTVTVKQRLVSTSTNRFYGWSTSGSISIAGTGVVSWSWENVPASNWNDSSLTEDGATYPCWVDLREGSMTIDVGYGTTKDINVSASWLFNEGSAGYLPQTYVTAAVSADVTLPMIAGASVPSVPASSVELGSPVTIYTNRVAAFTHTLTYSFGNASGVIAQGVGDSVQWAPPLDLARQIPNAVSGTAVITCTTYSGSTAIGSKQETVTLTVPESIVPAASASWEDTSGAYGLMESLVQNISKLAVTVSGTGAYGSTITGAAVSLEGKAYGGGVLTSSGNLSLTVSVTDSRGRVGSKAYPITVAPYSAPSLTLSASRCTVDGTADDTGDHARITVTGYVTQVNSRNTGDLVLNYGGTEVKANLGTGNVSYQTDPVYADPNATMTITAVLSDKLVSASRTMVLSTGYATLDLLAGGKGIAFGKAATKEGFDCAMPAFFTGGVSGITADDVGAAPSGYGLGTQSGKYFGASQNLDNFQANGYICTAAGVVDDNYGYWGQQWSMYGTYGTQTLTTVHGSVITRTKNNGKWGAWEWVNPPMFFGTEYRTTERYNGKVVYAKWINGGTLPASSTKIVSGVLSASYTVCDMRGIATKTDGAVVEMPAISDSKSPLARISILAGANLYIATFSDMSAYSLKVLLKYTKD